MALANSNFQEFLPVEVKTVSSHRFYTEEALSYRLELIICNGKLYFSLQKYKFHPQCGEYKPSFSIWFEPKTWHRFIDLGLKLSHLASQIGIFFSFK